MKKIILILLIACQYGFSQKKDENLGNEVVNIVKPYSPTISDAFKIKETPPTTEEIKENKLPIKYQIFSFPVASTFVPSKGVAAAVDKETLEKGFANYASLGLGNYGNINAEVFVAHQINSSDYVGGKFTHQSSQGGIKNVVLSDKFYHTGLDLTYGSKSKNTQWNIDLGVKNQIVNWYGLPSENFLISEAEIANLNTKQSYNTISLGGRIETKNDIFEEASLQFKRFSDQFDSGENSFSIQPKFTFDIKDIKANLGVLLDYVGGNFKKDNYLKLTDENYSSFIVGAKPGFLYQQDELSINIGAGLFYNNSKINSNSGSKFYVYPNIKASYRLVGDLLIAYAGAEGGLNQNSYANYVNQNPFVAPGLLIQPTDNTFDLYVGLKGKLSTPIAFNVRAGFNTEKDKGFFVGNLPLANTENIGYLRGNSYQVLYDNLNTLSLFGELKADFSKRTSFALSGNFNSFKTSTLGKAFNMPQFKVTSSVNINITKQWYSGVQLFFVGERYDFVPNLVTSLPIAAYTFAEKTLNSYFDLNAHVGYNYNDRLTAFIKGNNLANQSYNRFGYYPVQAIQVLLGASYKFDF